MEKEDKELEAIALVIKALSGLDPAQQQSALEYVLKRFNISFSTSAPQERAPVFGKPEPQYIPEQAAARSEEVKDIRSLKEEKKPKSAIQMAVLVAYYLSRVVPTEERLEVIGTAEIDKYFDQAKYPLPKSSAVLLGDAKRAGYLESAERGKYKLNPVGYNLAAHGMADGSVSLKKSGKKS